MLAKHTEFYFLAQRNRPFCINNCFCSYLLTAMSTCTCPTFSPILLGLLKFSSWPICMRKIYPRLSPLSVDTKLTTEKLPSFSDTYALPKYMLHKFTCTDLALKSPQHHAQHVRDRPDKLRPDTILFFASTSTYWNYQKRKKKQKRCCV